MSAEEETNDPWDTPFWRFVRETAERADRLPAWKQFDICAFYREESSHYEFVLLDDPDVDPTAPEGTTDR